MLKRRAAEAALPFVRSGMVLGVGTGSTAAFFIEALASATVSPATVVPSSDDTRRRLMRVGFSPVPPASVGALDLYVDGADEVDLQRRLVKGRGGALTREKVLASAAHTFVCIVDESKLTAGLGSVPVPVEVVPAAAGVVLASLVAMDVDVEEREDYLTDNGNLVFDLSGLDLDDPERTEALLDTLPGVVECGVFARRPADHVFCAGPDGVRTLGLPAA